MSDKTIYVTAPGYEKLKQELEYLKKVRRPEISNRIQEAKDLGDLSENAEYASAREDQAFAEGRIIEIEAMLKNIQVITTSADPDTVEIGDTITCESDGKVYSYTIVGSNEANPLLGLISNESPMGEAFLGKKKDETASVVTPKGNKTYTITAIKV